MLTYYTVMKYR